MKKLLLILAIAMQFVALAPVSSADEDLPKCYPCPVR